MDIVSLPIIPSKARLRRAQQSEVYSPDGLSRQPDTIILAEMGRNLFQDVN